MTRVIVEVAIVLGVITPAIGRAVAAQPTPQIALPRVELMPRVPRSTAPPFDFLAAARGYDQIVFGGDPSRISAKLMWWDESKINIDTPGIGMPSYVNHPEQVGGSNHEAITVLGSILGSTIAGIDKSRGEHDIAAMSAQYFNSKNGTNLVLNRVSDTAGHSYWYELFPQILFDAIATRYPANRRLTEISDIAAQRWLEAYDLLAKDGAPSFEHISFDFVKMTPVDTGKQREPDAAAGMACVFVAAHQRAGDKRFLDAAEVCLKTVEDRAASPSYEILMPFGAYAAARINAEHGGAHDVGLFINGYFEPTSDVRAGWGLIVGNWNGVEVSGLIGSVNDAAGYGFTMNTYATAIGLLPVARYDERYARSIAKWMLHASSAIRYCYPGQLPIEKTSRPNFTSDPANVIAFEGIRHRYNGVSPYAGGDPTVYGWGPCDLGLYGSGFVGVFGGSLRPTSDPLIPQIDLLATDPCPTRSLPTYLYFNPRETETTIEIDVGDAPVDLYDSLENKVIGNAQRGRMKLTLPADTARMIVRIPAGATIATDGRRSSVDGIVIDYANGQVPLPPIKPRPTVASKARMIDAMKFSPTIDGKPGDWARHPSTPLKLTTSGRGALEAEARFAWDNEYLYVLVRETHRGKDAHEAADLAAFMKAPWDFDAVNLFIDLGNGRRAALGDFVLQLSLQSNGQRDIAFSPQAPDDGSTRIAAATSGTREKGDRLIEARVRWAGLAAATFGDGATVDVKAGMTIGCEPSLVEMNHTRQSFIGGSQYQRPTGTDRSSTDVRLRE